MMRSGLAALMLLVAAVTACDKEAPSATGASGSAAPSPAAPAGSGPEGRYELDSTAYVKAMSESWKGRFDEGQIESMSGQLKAKGWVELKPGGAARTNLTTSMGGGPETPVNLEGTWTQNGDAIDIKPSSADQAKPLTCVLDGDLLACTAGGPQLLYTRKR